MPDISSVNDDEYNAFEGEVVMNGKTLGDLNMKRGGENGIKYFLKDIVKSQMKQSSGNQQSMFDLITHLKSQMSMKEVENEDANEDDTDVRVDEHSMDGTFKLVIDTEKVLCYL